MSSVSWGAKEKIDLVRKSSGLIVGGVLARLDTVWAAALSARNEDVRLDRNEDARLFRLVFDFGGVGKMMVSSCTGDMGSRTFMCWRG